jgi:hypothetical protein
MARDASEVWRDQLIEGSKHRGRNKNTAESESAQLQAGWREASRIPPRSPDFLEMRSKKPEFAPSVVKRDQS